MKGARETLEWLYFWAIRDSSREILAGFPYLSQIDNPLAQRATAFMKFVGPEEAQRMMRAIIATAHRRSTSSLDQLLIEQFRMWKLEEETSALEPDRWSSARKKITEFLRARFTSEGYVFLVEPGHCVAKVTLGDRTLETRIDLRGRLHAVSYEQILYEQCNVMLRTSILSWMGISGQTYWRDLGNDTAGRVSSLIFDLSVHLQRALNDAQW